MSDIALILAKKGSKGLPGKNLLIWKKKNSLEHTIEHLKKTKLFDKIYISTNCKIIGNIGKNLGCETIYRNDKLAKNSAYVKSVNHACRQIKKFSTITIPMVVQPVRNFDIFKLMLNKLKKFKLDSVVTVENFDASVAWLYKSNQNRLTKLETVDYKKEIGRRNDLVLINNGIVCFNYLSWKKSNGITPWPYLGKKILAVKQNFLNKNIKIDINDHEDKKWFFELTKKLKWKSLY